MRCSNTVFIFTQKTWCKIEVSCTSTIHFFCQILLSNIPVLENKISISHKVKKVNKKNYITTFHFYFISYEQISVLSYLLITTLSIEQYQQ